MTTTITPEELYFGAPVSLTYGGVECGGTVDPPVVGVEVTMFTPEFKNAKGPIKGTAIVTKAIPYCTFTVNQITAQKLAWAMPGSASTSSESVGQTRAGLSTTLAADPALGATTISLTSVTTVAQNDFILIGPGAGYTEANSEIVKVTTVGTAGGGNTVVENSAGGGLLIDHANGEDAKTVTGTILAAPAVAGAVNIKVDSVTGLAQGDFVRIGYVGHYETRALTAVGTTGPAGTGLTFLVPLTRDHALDEWVIEVTALGGTTITWDPGRVPSNAYQDLILTGVGLDGRQMIVTLFDAMSAENQELTFTDDAVTGLQARFTGYYDSTTSGTLPMSIQLD